MVLSHTTQQFATVENPKCVHTEMNKPAKKNSSLHREMRRDGVKKPKQTKMKQT
jgi:hypothetical protein